MTLQVEIATKHVADFAARYLELVGKRPSGESYIVVDSRETRKAPILSVFFTAASPAAISNLRALGYEVADFQRGEFSHAIVGGAAFWKLVANGYRVGAQAGIKPAPLPMAPQVEMVTA